MTNDNIGVNHCHQNDEETYTCAMWTDAGAIALGWCDVSMNESLAIAEDGGGWGANPVLTETLVCGSHVTD